MCLRGGDLAVHPAKFTPHDTENCAIGVAFLPQVFESWLEEAV